MNEKRIGRMEISTLHNVVQKMEKYERFLEMMTKDNSWLNVTTRGMKLDFKSDPQLKEYVMDGIKDAVEKRCKVMAEHYGIDTPVHYDSTQKGEYPSIVETVDSDDDLLDDEFDEDGNLIDDDHFSDSDAIDDDDLE